MFWQPVVWKYQFVYVHTYCAQQTVRHDKVPTSGVYTSIFVSCIHLACIFGYLGSEVAFVCQYCHLSSFHHFQLCRLSKRNVVAGVRIIAQLWAETSSICMAYGSKASNFEAKRKISVWSYATNTFQVSLYMLSSSLASLVNVNHLAVLFASFWTFTFPRNLLPTNTNNSVYFSNLLACCISRCVCLSL